MTISYIKGDATNPVSEGNRIIVHVCNDIGDWERGFVKELSNRWEAPEQQYKAWYKKNEDFTLGEVQFVQVEENLWVANLIGQHKVNRDKKFNPPIRYEAVLSGLTKVAKFAIKNKASVHMPRIGTGLAGGTWDKIEPLIESSLVSKKVAVTVYDL